MIIFLISIIILLILWNIWTNFIWKCTVMGLMYSAKVNHGWDIKISELEKMTKYSVKRNISNIFK